MCLTPSAATLPTSAAPGGGCGAFCFQTPAVLSKARRQTCLLGHTSICCCNGWRCQMFGRMLCMPLASKTNLPPGTDGQQSGPQLLLLHRCASSASLGWLL